MKTDEIGKKAALLSAVEVGLGSVLHGLSVPFAGHLLSLNQGFILTWATRQTFDRRAPALISTTASLLKSLSPAGKKLTPMLAIAMQGQLFTLGTLLGGMNILGFIVGMSLLCLWGFIQPLLIYGVLFGEAIIRITEFYLAEFSKVYPVTLENLVVALICVVILKLILGLICVGLAYRLPQKKIEQYSQWAMKQKPNRTSKRAQTPVAGAIGDLLSPFFLFSWILTMGFYFYAQGAHSETVWILMRPLALGFLLFLAIRLIPTTKAQALLLRLNPRLAKTLSEALEWMKSVN